MKGMSLAIETIIIVILAVTVLSVLLFFFRSAEGPVSDTIKLIQKQTSGCSAYVGYDSRCNNEEAAPQIKTSIADACQHLNILQPGSYPACSSGTGIDCIKQCCKTFCPA